MPVQLDPPTAETVVFVVLDENEDPIYCAGWPEACHEHINEAIGEDIEGAEKWTVREAVLK